MQVVSRAYKNSIRQGKRNRGHIKVTLGIVNSEAQKNIEIKESQNTLARFSKPRMKNSVSVTQEYATAEQNFSRLDKTQYFLPSASNSYYYNGAVTNALLGQIKITFGIKTGLNIKGLTIDFSDVYPTDFVITNGTDTYTYTDNTERYFSTEDTFDNTSYIQIIPSAMVGGQNRLRVYTITCGIANVFTNNEVIDYSGTEYVSAICETVPSNDVRISVNNTNLYYCPDDPNSALSYMELGQEVKVAFGYDVDDDGEIEWLEEQTSYLQSWSANELTAEFTATDRFDNINSTYYKGMVKPSGITLYELAEDILEDAGIENYFLDTYLNDIVVYNPIPPVDHASALQIVANAGRCTISQDRQGRIHIQSNFIPESSSSSEDETFYSHAENAMSDVVVKDYAEASQDYSTLDGNMYFAPIVSGLYWNETSYISDEVANANGGFVNNPVITVEMESAYSPFGLGISFGETYPRQFDLNLYLNDELTRTISIDNDTAEYMYSEQLPLFDRLDIEFTEGAPNSRVFVDKIYLGMESDYHLEDNTEMNAHPTATRQDKIKSVSIARTMFSEGTEVQNLFSENISVDATHNTHTVYFVNPSHGLSVSVVSPQSVSASISDYSAYFATITFSGITEETDVEYTIEGYEYTKEEQTYTVSHGQDGKEISWSNPLISSVAQAKELETWIYEWYEGDVEYEIDWRGDPRVDANDLFFMDNVLGETVKIRAYESTLEFSNSGWSGRMKARKVVVNE